MTRYTTNKCEQDKVGTNTTDICNKAGTSTTDICNKAGTSTWSKRQDNMQLTQGGHWHPTKTLVCSSCPPRGHSVMCTAHDMSLYIPPSHFNARGSQHSLHSHHIQILIGFALPSLYFLSLEINTYLHICIMFSVHRILILTPEVLTGT